MYNINKIKKLNEELQQLLETDADEVFNILKTAEENGFENYILRFSRLYDEIPYVDEDGYGSYDLEFNGIDTECTSYKKYIPLKPELEYDRILLGTNEYSEQGDYPSGWDYSNDTVSYTDYSTQSKDRYYLINVKNLKNNDMPLYEYIKQNYPESELAKLIEQANGEKSLEDIIEDLENEDFD